MIPDLDETIYKKQLYERQDVLCVMPAEAGIQALKALSSGFLPSQE